MGNCTLDNVLLPTRLYSFCNPGAVANPYVYLEQLEIWSDNGTVDVYKRQSMTCASTLWCWTAGSTGI